MLFATALTFAQQPAASKYIDLSSCQWTANDEPVKVPHSFSWLSPLGSVTNICRRGVCSYKATLPETNPNKTYHLQLDGASRCAKVFVNGPEVGIHRYGFLPSRFDITRRLVRGGTNSIEIKIDPTTTQHLYYEDSTVLRRLAYYPYIQLAVLLIFIAVAYFALISVKKAEQNKVWVGLSKETAHQLGTPISSLMAWTQMLESMGVEKEIVNDMDKDVHRLAMIADRFSKIGSMPDKELAYVNEAVTSSLEYMRTRIPKRVVLTIGTNDDTNCGVMLCLPLFAWVMENLTKNAVDAMDGEGRLDIDVGSDEHNALILVRDTGKGIARKNFKNVFNPGFTTKKRGWGLGLTLVKRIIEEYHGGRIYVKDSELGRGTTFAIEIPKIT